MPKSNNYPAAIKVADLQQAQQVAAQLEAAPTFVPDLLTTATLTPERLGLADKAAAAPKVMRRSF